MQNHAPLLSKTRLEAFSDGIFSIAATLLVLEIKVPDLAHATGMHAVALLASDWRTYLAYITSFLVIGVIWMNHHTLFHRVEEPDRFMLVMNLLLLLVVSFIPFPTALIAKYGSLQPVVLFYGIVFALTGIIYNLLFEYIKRKLDLAAQSNVDISTIRVSTIRQVGYPVLYLVAAGLSFVSTTTSIILYIAIPVVYLFPSPVEWQIRRRSLQAVGTSTPSTGDGAGRAMK